jgi:hypothetical protein
MELTQKIFIIVIFIIIFVIIGAILYYVFIYEQAQHLSELKIDTIKVTWSAPSESNCDVTLSTNQFIKIPICWSKQDVSVITGDKPSSDTHTITLPDGNYTIVAIYGTNATKDQIDITLDDMELNTPVVKVMDKTEVHPWTNYFKQGPLKFTLGKPTTVMGRFSNDSYSNNSSLSMIIVKE